VPEESRIEHQLAQFLDMALGIGRLLPLAILGVGRVLVLPRHFAHLPQQQHAQVTA
jgi:hypothetical protein